MLEQGKDVAEHFGQGSQAEDIGDETWGCLFKIKGRRNSEKSLERTRVWSLSPEDGSGEQVT